MPKCIYCLQEKARSEFNKEHVVPEMMGKYNGGFVLSRGQVCKECNSFFSNQLETKIGLNSMEGLLRIKYGRQISDGHKIKPDRVAVICNEKPFKGMIFIPTVDNTMPENIRYDLLPGVLILQPSDELEYCFYTLMDLPVATLEIKEYLKGKENGIITTPGLDYKEATSILIEKGYLNNNFNYSQDDLTDIYPKDDIGIQINIKVDPIIKRLCAKTVFNYLCFCNGTEYVLDQKFDDIRNYIRHGQWYQNLRFRFIQGGNKSIPVPNDTCHIVGTMFSQVDNSWKLYGCVTWFGQLSYVFEICDYGIPAVDPIRLPKTKMAVFDNTARVIKEIEGRFTY